MNKRKAMFLDMDGTLVDSNQWHAKAFQDAFLEKGYETQLEDVQRLIGKGGAKLIKETVGVDAKSEEGQELSDRKKEIFFNRYYQNVAVILGAQHFVESLKERGLSVWIASSGSKENVEKFIDLVGIQSVIDGYTSSSDVKHSKPDPDIILAALKKAECHADEALLLGDTPYDIEAARRAGVDCVGVLSGGWSRDELKEAIAVYAHVGEINDRIDEFLGL